MENRGPGEASTSGQDQGMAVELDNVVFGYDPRPCEDTQTNKNHEAIPFLPFVQSLLHGHSDVDKSE